MIAFRLLQQFMFLNICNETGQSTFTLEPISKDSNVDVAELI
jgi:hypothetical protein